MSATPPPGKSWFFTHEKLDVYQIAEEAFDIVDKISAGLRTRPDLADQMRRASLSIALNIAEGAAETRPKEKARFNRMAKRSTAETAAALRLARRRGFIAEDTYQRARRPLERCDAMLGALIARQESTSK